MFDPAAYLTALVGHLQGHFPTVPTVEEYPRLRRKITVPAILVELADLTALDPDLGTEQLRLTARLEARIILDQVPAPGIPPPDLAAMQLALAIAWAIHQLPRQPGAGPVKAINIEPDQFRPDLAGYAAWRIEWTHEVWLGDSVWDVEPGEPPSEVWVGYSPRIGEEHLDDYLLVSEPEDPA